MNDTMADFKQTAQEHMWRDTRAGRKWLCTCEACREMRALTGMDKLMGIWPLVRALQQTEDQLENLPDGPEKQAVQAQHDKLYDQLAAEMAR
jgi:hypothetical protein